MCTSEDKGLKDVTIRMVITYQYGKQTRKMPPSRERIFTSGDDETSGLGRFLRHICMRRDKVVEGATTPKLVTGGVGVWEGGPPQDVPMRGKNAGKG